MFVNALKFGGTSLVVVEGKRRREQQRTRCWMASLTQWT